MLTTELATATRTAPGSSGFRPRALHLVILACDILPRVPAGPTDHHPSWRVTAERTASGAGT